MSSYYFGIVSAVFGRNFFLKLTRACVFNNFILYVNLFDNFNPSCRINNWLPACKFSEIFPTPGPCEDPTFVNFDQIFGKFKLKALILFSNGPIFSPFHCPFYCVIFENTPNFP